MSFKTDLYGRRSLRTIRANAPARDRGHPMFHPTKDKGAAKRPPSSFQRTPAPCRGTSGLKRNCGRYGWPAVIDARLGAIQLWLRDDAASPSLSSPLEVCRVSVGLVRDADRVRNGFPNRSGLPFATPALNGLSPECRCEALRVASETYTAWLQAGQPHLTADNLNVMQSYILDCIRSGAASRSTAHIFKQSKDKN